MQFFIDLHTHTIASDHAYSTIVECVNLCTWALISLNLNAFMIS